MLTQRGQSTLEYAVLIACIVAACVGMQLYVKRGAMGKIRESTDQIGEQFSPAQEAYTGLTRTVSGHRIETSTVTGGAGETMNALTQNRSATSWTTAGTLAQDKDNTTQKFTW